MKSVNGLFASGSNELFGESFAEDGPCAALMTSRRVEVSLGPLAVRVVSVRVTEYRGHPLACSAMIRHSRASC